MNVRLCATLGLTVIYSLLSVAQAKSVVSPNSVPEKISRLLLPQYHSSAECQNRPDFLTEQRTEIMGNISKLPAVGVLVARDAEFYVEGKASNGSPIRVHGYQSFLKSTDVSRILCGAAAKGVQERYSIFAPTLIDTSKAAKVGHSVWQFQLVANNEKFSAWNMKSPASNAQENLDKLLTKLGSNYRLYQIGHNEYELMIIREYNGVAQYLSVRYDAVASLK